MTAEYNRSKSAVRQSQNSFLSHVVVVHRGTPGACEISTVERGEPTEPVILPVMNWANTRTKEGELQAIDPEYWCPQAPMTDAFTRRYDWDAHIQCYQLQTTGKTPRLRKSIVPWLEDAGSVVFPELTAVVVDFDNADYKAARDDDRWQHDRNWRIMAEHEHREWRSSFRWKMRESLPEYAFAGDYDTRGGIHLAWPLATPLRITPDSELIVEARIRGFLDYIRECTGLEPDYSCTDWTRLYRLPFVRRDRSTQTPETASFESMAPIELRSFRPVYKEGQSPEDVRQRRERTAELMDRIRDLLPEGDRGMVLRRAIAYASMLDVSVSGVNGRNNLFRATLALRKGFALDHEGIVTALIESGWNDACVTPGGQSDPWSYNELAEAALRAIDYSEQNNVACGEILAEEQLLLEESRKYKRAQEYVTQCFLDDVEVDEVYLAHLVENGDEKVVSDGLPPQSDDWASVVMESLSERAERSRIRGGETRLSRDLRLIDEFHARERVTLLPRAAETSVRSQVKSKRDEVLEMLRDCGCRDEMVTRMEGCFFSQDHQHVRAVERHHENGDVSVYSRRCGFHKLCPICMDVESSVRAHEVEWTTKMHPELRMVGGAFDAYGETPHQARERAADYMKKIARKLEKSHWVWKGILSAGMLRKVGDQYHQRGFMLFMEPPDIEPSGSILDAADDVESLCRIPFMEGDGNWVDPFFSPLDSVRAASAVRNYLGMWPEWLDDQSEFQQSFDAVQNVSKHVIKGSRGLDWWQKEAPADEVEEATADQETAVEEEGYWFDVDRISIHQLQQLALKSPRRAEAIATSWMLDADAYMRGFGHTMMRPCVRLTHQALAEEIYLPAGYGIVQSIQEICRASMESGTPVLNLIWRAPDVTEFDIMRGEAERNMQRFFNPFQEERVPHRIVPKAPEVIDREMQLTLDFAEWAGIDLDYSRPAATASN